MPVYRTASAGSCANACASGVRPARDPPQPQPQQPIDFARYVARTHPMLHARTHASRRICLYDISMKAAGQNIACSPVVVVNVFR